LRITWIQPEDLVRHEFAQAADEGKEIQSIVDRWVAAGGDPNPPHEGATSPAAPSELVDLARDLLEELEGLPVPTAADEPNDFDAIRNAWQAAPVLPPLPTPAALRDRIHGAWLGRAIGCLLGKPVERTPREGIREILEATGRWPLAAYFTAQGLPTDVADRWPWNRASRTTSLAEVIDGMPEDDDLNYTLLALRALEEHGPGFTTDDVARIWLRDLPALRVFTAERIAYRNLLEGLQPPETATRLNPYREWIGAQIRTDLYGWVRPGDPHGAAELAWRDARLSHTRNGIYGAMFVAAMASAALVSDDVELVLDAGLSVVPPRSRLAGEIRTARQGAAAADFETAVDDLYARHRGRHWVHALNNTGLSVQALTAGQGDFVRSICLVVSGGWDTDSNGATVGAVCGAMTGAAGLPESWTSPLRNHLDTSIPGFGATGFDTLADRTITLVAAAS
jgi:ADP-ribosylglycohydrolase